MPKYDVAIDFGSYYVDSVEAKDKEEAEKKALEQWKKDQPNWYHHIVNTDVVVADG